MESNQKMWIAWQLYSYNVGPGKLKRMSKDGLVKLHRQIDICLEELEEFVKELKADLHILPERDDRFFVNHCLCHPCINGSATYYQTRAHAKDTLRRPYVSAEERYNPPICAEGD